MQRIASSKAVCHTECVTIVSFSHAMLDGHRLRDRNVNTNVLESAVAAASDRSNWKQLFDRRECVSVNVLRIHV